MSSATSAALRSRGGSSARRDELRAGAREVLALATRARELDAHLGDAIVVLGAGIVGAAVVSLRFILVPMLAAQFISFLYAPLLNLMEKRPLQCLGCSWCNPRRRFCLTKYYRLRSDPQTGFLPNRGLHAQLTNFFLLGRLPHTLALLILLGATVAAMAGLWYMISSSLSDFATSKAYKSAGARLPELQLNVSRWLVEQGIVKHNNTLSSQFSTDHVVDLLGAAAAAIPDVGLVMLLAVYLTIGRKPARYGLRYSDEKKTLVEQIEAACKRYILVMSTFSLLITILVTAVLHILHVHLAFVFGLLTFALNFVPVVGSMISVLLPIPVCLIDDELPLENKLMAVAIPLVIQLYAQLYVEPVLFGRSMNLSPLAVLISLVFWSVVWGLSGALMSVPLLAATKVVLQNSDNRMARALQKMF